MKTVKLLARIIVGLTFIFSGFVKGIDPLGSAYKFNDYFGAMGMDWLIWAAFPLGVLLSFTEFLIGVALLFNQLMKVFSWLALLFMIFFTGLTLWVAKENPVTDCGCFGDALVISNWATFYKNIVLLALTILIFKHRKNSKPFVLLRIEALMAIVVIGAYIGIGVLSYNHLPILDFRPYKVGVNISEAMSIPKGAPKEIYKNIFFYKNNESGEVKKFDDTNYPWQDTINWAYESMGDPILVQKGYEPPIHDFRIETKEGEDISDFFLYDEDYVFILIAYDIDKTNTKNLDKIRELSEWALKNKLEFIGLTSSPTDVAEIFLEGNGCAFEFFNCDEVTLKTIIRANPGLIVIKNGTIEGKWHFNDIPSPEKFSSKFLNK